MSVFCARTRFDPVFTRGNEIFMKGKWLASAITGAIILIISAVGCVILLNLKKAPAEASTAREEKPLHVEVIAVSPERIPTAVTGYGLVSPLEEVPIASEINGTVVWKHPNLIEGGVIEKGAKYLEIDPAPYEARVRDAQAVIAQWETTVRRLEVEWANEKERLVSLRRSFELAEAEYNRAKLTAEQGIGSQADVDKAEREFVDAQERIAAAERDIALYPIRIEETKNQLASAQEKQSLATLDLAKTELHAPFTARVKSVNIAPNQLVMFGETIAVLADDSVLELHVPLDGREARRWLRYDSAARRPETHWFGALDPVACEIRWTEDPERHSWEGQLHRITAFDEESRTLTVAVRVNGSQALPREGDAFPLVEGMFCQVTIPGRDMQDVYRLPGGTVTIANTVYIVENDRLRTVPVVVERAKDDVVFVSSGLEPGQQVITTRLINPLENTLCAVVHSDAAQEAAL
jgi:multidrug efflux pump subunit AcrA (membrane-fusion protein)